jgi:hypothetical protein
MLYDIYYHFRIKEMKESKRQGTGGIKNREKNEE